MELEDAQLEDARPGRQLPVVVRARTLFDDMPGWAAAHREPLRALLHEHGAVLLRGFGCNEPDSFGRVVSAVCAPPLAYTERSSPRTLVGGNVYTSTEHPASRSIFLHNEQSYNDAFVRFIAFFCVTPPDTEGETPIADCRRIYARIDPAIRDRFVREGYLVIRNYRQRFGLPWSTVFGTSDRAAVEAYCTEHDIEVVWQADDELQTRQVRRVAGLHPETNEPTWFNHLTFFHWCSLPVDTRTKLVQLFKDPDLLTTNTAHADGTAIDREVMDHLRSVYIDEETAFAWQAGDILLLDNMLVAHGRRPFTGPRRILTALAAPTQWASIAEPRPGSTREDRDRPRRP